MLLIKTSSVHDGSIRDSSARNILNENGRNFLQTHSIALEHTSLVYLSYDSDTFTRYAHASGTGDGIITPSQHIADGLVTDKTDVALVLPIADCIGAVLHDPVKNILMLSHLGRHNLEQLGGTKSVEYMVEQFECDPKNITVWFSPAAGKENYPLYDFDNRSMYEAATKQLITAGISPDHITASSVDTTQDPNYFSHSEFKKGNRAEDGRFMIVASQPSS